MGGITDLVRGIVAILGDTLPPWAILVVAAILLGLGIPLYLRGQRREIARRRIAATRGISQPEVGRLEAEALALVGNDPDGLVVVAEEALRQGREGVARQAIERLEATGRRPAHVARLLRLQADPLPRLPEEEALAVTRLLDAGLADPARQRLRRARERWPDLPEWDDLEARLPDVRSGPDGPGPGAPP